MNVSVSGTTVNQTVKIRSGTDFGANVNLIQMNNLSVELWRRSCVVDDDGDDDDDDDVNNLPWH